MDDNEAPSTESDGTGGASAADAPPPASAPSQWRARLKKWAWITGATAIVLPIVVFVVWTAIALKYSYSTGYRAGYVQKISKKGWLCSTWEGELQLVSLPGAVPERWSFTVPEDIVAAAVERSVGQQVALEYEEHRGIPSTCFGDTPYFVVGVRTVAP